MGRLVSSRHWWKNTGHLLTGIIFLGTIEISASTGGCDTRTTLHAAHQHGTIAAADEIISEAEEERDIETRTAQFLLATNIRLPEANPQRSYLLPEPGRDCHIILRSHSHPRAPPLP